MDGPARWGVEQATWNPTSCSAPRGSRQACRSARSWRGRANGRVVAGRGSTWRQPGAVAIAPGVIESENLLANAAELGGFLLGGLRELWEVNDLITDVDGPDARRGVRHQAAAGRAAGGVQRTARARVRRAARISPPLVSTTTKPALAASWRGGASRGSQLTLGHRLERQVLRPRITAWSAALRPDRPHGCAPGRLMAPGRASVSGPPLALHRQRCSTRTVGSSARHTGRPARVGRSNRLSANPTASVPAQGVALSWHGPLAPSSKAARKQDGAQNHQQEPGGMAIRNRKRGVRSVAWLGCRAQVPALGPG